MCCEGLEEGRIVAWGLLQAAGVHPAGQKGSVPLPRGLRLWRLLRPRLVNLPLAPRPMCLQPWKSAGTAQAQGKGKGSGRTALARSCVRREARGDCGEDTTSASDLRPPSGPRALVASPAVGRMNTGGQHRRGYQVRLQGCVPGDPAQPALEEVLGSWGGSGL